jgi:hypothetical protein
MEARGIKPVVTEIQDIVQAVMAFVEGKNRGQSGQAALISIWSISMKILLTTSPDIEALLDPLFGRGAHFLIVDTNTLDGKAGSCPVGCGKSRAGCPEHCSSVLEGFSRGYASSFLK